MNDTTRRLAFAALAAAACAAPLRSAADGPDCHGLTSDWWQWAVSIPAG